MTSVSLPAAPSGTAGRLWTELRFPTVAYVLSRLLFLVIALIDAHVQHWGLGDELHHWDGNWYLQLVTSGYPHRVLAAPGDYSTLGFMPLYPLLIRLIWHTTQLSPLGSGLVISLVGGYVATVFIGRLARRWWDAEGERRALVFWCLWPGTIVFSMVYPEGISIALISGAMLAAGNRRWLLAGLCCAFATATASIAAVLVPALGICALLEVRRLGIRDRAAQRAVAGFVISPAGLVAFWVFLWRWTGTPLAMIDVQRGAWHNHTTLAAIPNVVSALVNQIRGIDPSPVGPSGIDPYYCVILLATAFLLWALTLMWRERARIPVVAGIYTVIASAVLVTSPNASPDPRMLLSVFPAMIVVGARTTGRRRIPLLGVTLALTLLLSWRTFVGDWMLP